MQRVPGAVIFKDNNLFLASQVQDIFSESNVQNLKKLKKKRGSEEGSSSPDLMKADEEEIKALMSSLDNVAGLNESLDHVLFSMTLFKNKLCREVFKSRSNDAMKFKFVDELHEWYLESLQQPPGRAGPSSRPIRQLPKVPKWKEGPKILEKKGLKAKKKKKRFQINLKKKAHPFDQKTKFLFTETVFVSVGCFNWLLDHKFA